MGFPGQPRRITRSGSPSRSSTTASSTPVNRCHRGGQSPGSASGEANASTTAPRVTRWPRGGRAGSAGNTSSAASTAANKIKVAAALVAVTRTLIRDLLADLAGPLIAWGIPAAAAAVPSAGASIAAFITRAITKAVQIGGKVAQFLKKLFGALVKLSAPAKRAGSAMRKQSDDLAAPTRQAPNTPPGNQTAADLLHRSTTRASRADGLDNVTRRADGWAATTNQRVGDWADRVKQGGPARQQKVEDLYARLGQPPLSTRSADMPDPGNGVQRAGHRVDSRTGGGVLDGQNWIRAVASRDIGHLMPTPGDLVALSRRHEGAEQAVPRR